MQLPRLLKIGSALAMTLLVGCSSLRYVGYRPDLPVPTGPCKTDLETLQRTSHDLAESYAWRASYNRNAIYAGGVLLLGTVAATGGLGAAAAASLSIALLAVSGGFVSGSMLLFHNAELALAYTEAEASVNTALGAVDPSAKCDGPHGSYNTLLKSVTDAINKLEHDRTTIAQSASNTEIKALRKDVDGLKAALTASPTTVPTAAGAPAGDDNQ